MFRIVTDTSSNLPTAYLQAENITVIPFTFHTESGEQSCMDTATFDAKAFYTAMRNGEKVTTSQIPPQRFVDYLHPMLEAEEDVLFVSMSSGISGSYASSKIAANQLSEDRRYVLCVFGRGHRCHARGRVPRKGHDNRRNVYAPARAAASDRADFYRGRPPVP